MIKLNPTPLHHAHRRSGSGFSAHRFCMAALAATLMLLASACGPGVGGTGTGSEAQLARFGATAVPLCSSELALLLACTPTANLPATTPAPPGVAGGASSALDTLAGSDAVRFADATQRVLALVQANRIELSAACVGLSFSGDWGLVAGQAPSFYGQAESRGYTGPAVLEARLVGSALQLRLLDERGQVLLGPLVLTRSSVTQPAACG